MNESDWKMLIAIKRLGSISEAAKYLYVSQPALTYRLHKLENEFNKKIIMTSRKGTCFTPQGEFLVEYAERMLEEKETLKLKINDYNGEIGGTLKIAVANSFANYKLPKIISDFSKQFPKIKIILRAEFSHDVMRRLYNEEVHIGISSSNMKWPDERIIIANEKIVTIHTEAFDIQQLNKLPMIWYNANVQLRKSILDWWHDHFSAPPIIRMEVDYVETCKRMVYSGVGYGIVPEFCLNSEDRIYSVPLVDREGNILSREIYLDFRSKDFENIPCVKHFVQFLENFKHELG